MEIGIGKALQYSLLGIGIVFAMIIVLMIVVKLMTLIVGSAEAAASKSAAAAQSSKEIVENDTSGTGELAPGSAGELKLYNVSDRDAAMIMAIVADRLKVPLNELRFKSIREIEGAETP